MTLYLDFETSPIVGWGWQLWNKSGPAFFHIEQDVQIISVAWAEDDGPVQCVGVDDFKGYRPGIRNLNDKKLVEFFAPKFEKADYVVAHNGNGFDFKLWRTRLIVHGKPPHHEPKALDTKQWANRFMFTSKSQDGISRQLKTPRKVEKSPELHHKCIELGLPRYWKEMKYYNKGDVVGLRENAKRLAPFVAAAPNANVHHKTRMNCTNLFCKGPRDQMIMRGPRPRSKTGEVQTYQCKSCGKYATGPVIQAGVILR